MLLSSQVFYDSLMFQLDSFSRCSFDSWCYFCTFQFFFFFPKGDVVKSTSMSWLLERRSSKMLLLPLGQRPLSTAFCVHPPPHQSSTRQEGAQGDRKGKHCCKIARKGKSTWPPTGEEKGPRHQGDTYVCSWRCHHKVLQPLQCHRVNGRQSGPGVRLGH